MNMPEWLQWATLLVGTGGPGVTVGMLVKARSEVRKTSADTTHVIVGASELVIKQLENSVKRLDDKVHQLEKKDTERDEREEQHETILRLHSRWDRTVAEELRERGVPIADPPPLYPATG